MKLFSFSNVCLFTSTLIFSELGFATAGSTDYGYGVLNKGMAGTGVAFPQDTFAPSINPAGLAFVDHQLDVGATIFSPRRGYEATEVSSPFGVAPGKHWSNKNYFPVPQLGFNKPFCNQRAAFGISLYGNGGMNTSYGDDFSGSTIGPASGVYGAYAAGVDFKQMFINMAVAWKVNPIFSLGLSLIPAIQMIEVNGLSPFSGFSVDPKNLTNRGTDFSYGLGARVGLLVKPSPFFSAGISYQPKITMTEFDHYRGLFANHGEIDVPATGTIGITLNPREDFAINGDIQRIWYQDVTTFGHTTANCIPGSGIACLGAKDGAGFSWKNTTVYKIGLQWKTNELWTWRAGFAHATQPVPFSSVSNLFNILAPAVTQDHYTIGFTRVLNRCLLLNTNFMYAPQVSSTGYNQFNASQRITLFMHQYEIGASLTWKIDA